MHCEPLDKHCTQDARDVCQSCWRRDHFDHNVILMERALQLKFQRLIDDNEITVSVTDSWSQAVVSHELDAMDVVRRARRR